MSTVVFNAYWPECRMKFCFSLISPDKWSSGGRKNSTWPTLAQDTFIPHRHLHETHHTELRAQQSQPSLHGQDTLTAPAGYKGSTPLAPLPYPSLAWDRAGRISSKGKGTAFTVCCTRVALLQPCWVQSSAASGLCAQTVTREVGTAGKVQGRRMSHHREGEWTEPGCPHCGASCGAREAQEMLHRHWEYLRTWGQGWAVTLGWVGRNWTCIKLGRCRIWGHAGGCSAESDMMPEAASVVEQHVRLNKLTSDNFSLLFSMQRSHLRLETILYSGQYNNTVIIPKTLGNLAAVPVRTFTGTKNSGFVPLPSKLIKLTLNCV